MKCESAVLLADHVSSRADHMTVAQSRRGVGGCVTLDKTSTTHKVIFIFII